MILSHCCSSCVLFLQAGLTPLHVAGTVEIANVLLKAGANAEAVTNVRVIALK